MPTRPLKFQWNTKCRTKSGWTDDWVRRRPPLVADSGSGRHTLPLQILTNPRHYRSRVPVQDLLSCFLADLRIGERLSGPVNTKCAAICAAHDPVGAIQAHRCLDGARAERVAIDVNLRLAEARRRQLLVRCIEQAPVVH